MLGPDTELLSEILCKLGEKYIKKWRPSWIFWFDAWCSDWSATIQEVLGDDYCAATKDAWIKYVCWNLWWHALGPNQILNHELLVNDRSPLYKKQLYQAKLSIPFQKNSPAIFHTAYKQCCHLHLVNGAKERVPWDAANRRCVAFCLTTSRAFLWSSTNGAGICPLFNAKKRHHASLQ